MMREFTLLGELIPLKIMKERNVILYIRTDLLNGNIKHGQKTL